MNEIDFEIYKTIQQEKKLTEIYLGSTPVSCPFAIVHYRADYTEAVPFTPFDKVICGLLNIDDILSFDEIASILGLNVIDKPEENKYKDFAEYEILSESLTSLVSFGMIEKGDSFFGRCRLTDIGKEYTVKGFKFKTTKNNPFTLYFDIYTNDHKKAKSIFQDCRPIKLTEIETEIDFKDEVYLKSFAQFQIPEIYNPDKKKSFTNISIVKTLYRAINLYAGLIYDFQLNTFRIKIYSDQSNSDYFTEKINSNEDLKDIVLDQFFAESEVLNELKPERQNKFEEETCNIQSDADYLIYQNKPQEAVEKINQFYKQTEIIEYFYFWNNLDTIIDDVIEIWLSVSELNKDTYCSILKLSSNKPNIKVFVQYNTKNIDIKDEANNLFWRRDDCIFFCLVHGKSGEYKLFQKSNYHFSCKGKNYTSNVIFKTKVEEERKGNIMKFKKDFVKDCLPEMIAKYKAFLQNSFAVALGNIEAIQESDVNLHYFKDYISESVFSEQYDNLQKLKNEKLSQMMIDHQKLLHEEIDNLITENKIEEFESIEKLNDIKEKLKQAEFNCLPEYVEIIKEIEQLNKRISEKETYIKEQLTKHYIIDTNVFVDCPEILSKIDIKHQIVLSAKVIDELDNLKRKLKGNEKNNVQKALKLINQKLGEKSNTKTAQANLKLLPPDFSDKSPDNLILCVALMYKDKNPYLITSDNGLQIKAKTCDIPTSSLQKFMDTEPSIYTKNKKRKPSKNTLIEIYNSVSKDGEESVLMNEFQTAIATSIKNFSYLDYDCKKFKDFCELYSDIFKIKINAKKTHCIKLISPLQNPIYAQDRKKQKIFNTSKKKQIPSQKLVGIYKSALKDGEESVLMNEFQSAISTEIKDFSQTDYGFNKFKDFCESYSDTFDIVRNNNKIYCITLKTK
jgi:rRNA-processing protein FCF1